MTPYPASSDDADRAAKLHDDESVPGAMALGMGRLAADGCREEPSVDRPPADKDDDGELPPVWKRYIDSRLKQFCTR